MIILPGLIRSSSSRRRRALTSRALVGVAALLGFTPFHARAQPVGEEPAEAPPAPLPAAPAAPPPSEGGSEAPTAPVVTPPAPASAQPDKPGEPPADGAPPAHRGLQVSVDLGFALPLGRFEGGTSTPRDKPTLRQSNDLSRFFGSQGTLVVEVGAKVQDHIFVGGYLGGSLGGSGTDFDSPCGQSNVSCLANGLRFGLIAKYHILPAGFLNPWLGVGVGYEVARFSAKGPGGDASVTATGIEMPLTAGADIRITKNIGFGPKIDLTVANFVHAEGKSNGAVTSSDTIENQAIHSWMNLGARVVFNP